MSSYTVDMCMFGVSKKICEIFGNASNNIHYFLTTENTMTSFSVSCADDLTKTTGFIEILCVQTSYKYCKYTTQKCKGENLQFGNFATPSEFAISLS